MRQVLIIWTSGYTYALSKYIIFKFNMSLNKSRIFSNHIIMSFPLETSPPPQNINLRIVYSPVKDP